MLFRLGLYPLLVASLATASDDLATIHRQEDALADAINSHNKAVLYTLTSKDFHVSWNYGSVVEEFQTDLTRGDWINQITSLQVASYDLDIKRLDRAGPAGVQVILDEFITLRSPRGRTIQKRVRSTDIWMRQEDIWKLVTRLCHSEPQY